MVKYGVDKQPCLPQEICDLNPQKSCRFATKLVPKLDPVRECTVVPKGGNHFENHIELN